MLQIVVFGSVKKYSRNIYNEIKRKTFIAK